METAIMNQMKRNIHHYTIQENRTSRHMIIFFNISLRPCCEGYLHYRAGPLKYFQGDQISYIT